MLRYIRSCVSLWARGKWLLGPLEGVKTKLPNRELRPYLYIHLTASLRAFASLEKKRIATGCLSLHKHLKALGNCRIIDAQSSDQAKSERIRFQFCHGWQNSFANPDIHKDTALNLCVLAQLSARMQMPKNGPSHLWIYIFVSDVVNPVIRYNLLLGIVFMIGSITVSF